MNRPTLGWRYGTVAWVTNCGPHPHYHVVQATGAGVCLTDAEGLATLNTALLRIGLGWMPDPGAIDTNDRVPSPGRPPLRYP